MGLLQKKTKSLAKRFTVARKVFLTGTRKDISIKKTLLALGFYLNIWVAMKNVAMFQKYVSETFSGVYFWPFLLPGLLFSGLQYHLSKFQVL